MLLILSYTLTTIVIKNIILNKLTLVTLVNLVYAYSFILTQLILVTLANSVSVK